MPWIIVSLLLFGALASGLAARAEEARSPEGVERPFAEPGLGGFTKWLKKTGHDDPQDVFRLEDGMLRCGDEDMGYVARRRSYRDYRLSVEYRWGSEAEPAHQRAEHRRSAQRDRSRRRGQGAVDDEHRVPTRPGAVRAT